MKKLIFICTGNTCRSPMAEYLLRARLAGRAEWEISSAGVAAFSGCAPSDHAVAVMRELGIDISGHRSSLLTHDRIREADLLIVMTRSHLRAVTAAAPEAEHKTFLLKSFAASDDAGDIADPFGDSETAYRRVREEIDSAVSDLVLFLIEQENRK